MSEPRFNYIITIYNKELMIGKVLEGVKASCGKNGHIYPVLDGCTDGTEGIVDAFGKDNPTLSITKVYASNVHELLSINAGLRAASHQGEGYNIVLQDDVVLQDPALEKKVMDLYEWGGEKLGYVSFRLGAQLAPDTLESGDSVPLADYCENAYGHGLSEAQVLLPGQFAYRDIPIKSPVCFPFKLIREVGLLEEKLAPYAHDDVDYGIRCINAGFYNGVFALKFESKIEWGGTRQKVHPRMAKIIAHNMDQIRGWFPGDIKRMAETPKRTEIVDIPGAATDAEREEATGIWQANQRELDDFQKKDKRLPEKVAMAGRSIMLSGKDKAGKLMRAPKVATALTVQETSRLWMRRHQKELMHDLSFTEAAQRYPDHNELYRYMHHYFYHFLPKQIREHRTYFSQEKRGFGEDAFHVMWWLLLREFKPAFALEIGVYRGQVISLWALISKIKGLSTDIHGISPFTSAGDTVSIYSKTVDYLADVRESFTTLDIPQATLVKALSTDTDAARHIADRTWDLIYIDGNHDYDVVLADYRLCLKNLSEHGIIVFDDAALETGYNPPPFATAGHPGPTRVVEDIVRKEMNFLGAVGHNMVFQKR
jgi:glycosyltransferase involved in cell wall biosynthesis